MKTERDFYKAGCGVSLAILLALSLGTQAILAPRPSPEEKAGWLPATGHLYAGVVIYLGDIAAGETPKPLGTFQAFEKHQTLPNYPPTDSVRVDLGGGQPSWLGEKAFTDPDLSKLYWVRKDDPALAGH